MPLITENFLVLSPAYGIDFTKGKLATDNFRSGADWKRECVGSADGTYCSIRDFAKGVRVELRYNGCRNTTIVRV
jgi:hypothetical protein